MRIYRKFLVLVINVVWMFSICGCFYLLCNQWHACLHTSQTTVFVIFQMKKKTKTPILASVASVLLVGVTLLRKLQRRRRQLPRAPYVNHAAEREEYINSILHGSEGHCVNQIRMKSIAFHHLCHILTEGEHVHPTIHMSVTEQVFIFLHIISTAQLVSSKLDLLESFTIGNNIREDHWCFYFQLVH